VKQSSGIVWPIGIAIAIILVFGFCVGTVVVTQSANIQESDAYMTHYQDADANVNKLIKAEIAFNKKYDVSLKTRGISQEGTDLEYIVVDNNGKSVDNAEMILAISRPETSEFNQELSKPTLKDGIYTFEAVKFPKEGVWNLVLKVSVGDNYRFYNVKVDTRKSKIKEF
jgi:nitrogen fixation protein FixH